MAAKKPPGPPPPRVAPAKEQRPAPAAPPRVGPPRPGAAPPRPAPGGVAAASASAAHEPETLLAPRLGGSTTHERVKQAETDPVPDSDVIPLLSVPPPGKDADKYIGCTIDGRYVVESVLGEGGMGVVYKCRRRVFDKTVAVKILRSDLARDHEATERFVTEAKAASAIGNAHIVDVFDFGELPDGSTYFAMEYLEGETLGAAIASGKLVGSPRAVSTGRQLAEGLSAAHAAQIIHRDLKPDNVFITQREGKDFVKILDFGIAKVSGAQNKITRAGAVFGTPHYMSPEQCRGSSVDHRSDIYALGVILYEMISGRVPFDAENPLSILSMHLNDPPPALGALEPPVRAPDGFEDVILKCLAKAPEARFQAMKDVAQALVAVERGEALDIEVPISVAPPPPEALAGLGEPPLSTRSLPSDPRASFADAVRPSLPGEAAPVSGAPGRVSLPGLAGAAAGAAPVSVRQPAADLEATLRAAAQQADAEREWQATAGRKRRWLPFALVGGVVLVGAGAFVVSSAMPVPTLAEPFQAGRPLIIGHRVEARAAETPSSMVALVLSPIDAHVWREGRDLGTMPVEIPVKQGQTVEVEVRRDGYWTRKLSFDGSKPKLTVRLAPVAGGRPPPFIAGSAGVGAAPAPGAVGPHPAPAPPPEEGEPEGE